MGSIDDSEDIQDPMIPDSGPAEDAASIKPARGLDSMFDDLDDEESNAVNETVPEPSKQEEGSGTLNANEDLPQSETERGTDYGDDDQGGLFGSGSEDEGSVGPSKVRQLDDEEIDSGDDEDRNDRALGSQVDGGAETEEEIDNQKAIECHVERRHVPASTERETFLLKFPYFVRLDPVVFSPRTFQLPARDLNTDPTLPTSLSRFAVATNTLRWRHSPKDPTKMEADSRVLVWSDGSMTLQVANNPRAQFQLPAKPLVPPPVYSQLVAERSKDKRRISPGKYEPRLDAYMYLAAPHESALLLRLTNHVTTALSVLPSSDINNEALNRLQESLAAAKRINRQTNRDGTISLMDLKEDPELAKKRAEVAERDRSRQQKKLAASIMRETERANRTLAKSGLRSTGGGLSVSALEGDEVMSPRRAKAKRSGAGKRGGRGRHSDSDDDMPRGRTREDEYDKTDDFIVDTDEEEEGLEGDGEDDDDDEEILDDGSGEEQTAGKARGAKRKRPEKKSGGKKDKTGSGSRRKRRRTSEGDEDGG